MADFAHFVVAEAAGHFQALGDIALALGDILNHLSQSPKSGGSAANQKNSRRQCQSPVPPGWLLPKSA